MENLPNEINQNDFSNITEVKNDFRGERVMLKKEAFVNQIKRQFNVDIENVTIDEKVEKKIGWNFSPAMVKELLNIAKEKNPNEIKNIHILTNNIADHVEYTEDIFGDPTGLSFEEKRRIKSEKVLEILKTEVKKLFNSDPKVVDSFGNQEIKNNDLIIMDRHNEAVRISNINEKFPRQVSILPMETELDNNRKFLGGDFATGELINMLREDFEK